MNSLLNRFTVYLYSCQSPDEVVRLVAHLDLSAEFREIRQYSNISYIIASEIITRLSKIPFIEFIKTRIFDKIGMDHSTYQIRQVDCSKRVQGFVQDDIDMIEARKAWATRTSKGTVIPKECTGIARAYEWDINEKFTNNGGAGGIWSSGNDMVNDILSLHTKRPH